MSKEEFKPQYLAALSMLCGKPTYTTSPIKGEFKPKKLDKRKHMKQKAKIIMLPTDKSTLIHHKSDGRILTPLNYPKDVSKKYQPFHLYITTDDEIKEGDCYLWTKNDGTDGVVLRATTDGGSIKFNSKKIIATTDPELNLPQPSKEFIEEYCKVGGIDEVDVEYGLFHDGNFKDDNKTHAFKATRKPRVNSHKEITIYLVKDSCD